MDFFEETPFWTVGEQTHQYLRDELRVESWYPELMTGEGIIQSLVEKNQSRILLISAHEPRQSFIDGLTSAGIHFFHFPVYATRILSNADFLVTNHYYEKGNPAVINQKLKKEFELIKELKVDGMPINTIFKMN